MKIIFFGNHLYGHHSLHALLEHGFTPSLIIANRSRTGERPWYPSVAELGNLNGIEVIKANKVAGDEKLRQKLANLKPDLFVLSSFRNLLDLELLSIPRLGSINLHMAPLPQYRGAHPENWAIINGEAFMGFTVHYLEEGIDTGDIILQDSVPVLPEDDILSLTFKLADAGPKMLIQALNDIKLGKATRAPQDQSQSSFFPPRKPENGEIDWTLDTPIILNLIRALARPYPGTFCFFDREKVTVWRAKNVPGISGKAGKILNRDETTITVATGDGAVIITEFEIATN